MKRSIAIFLFLVAMTTATFAGTGLTITTQGRMVQVEVVDNNLYHVAIIGETNELINNKSMTHQSGSFKTNIPEGNDYIEVIITNTQTGATEIVKLHVE